MNSPASLLFGPANSPALATTAASTLAAAAATSAGSTTAPTATAPAAISAATSPALGAVRGGPAAVLRLEALLLLAGALAAYHQLDGSWGRFALMFLLPDLSLLAYLAGPRRGAFFYNLAHSTLLPGALALTALLGSSPALGCAAAVWLGHIGFDRALGYGLKYQTAFIHTHLGRIGRAAGQVRHGAE